MSRVPCYASFKLNYLAAQQQVLNALELHPEFWADGSDYAIAKLLRIVQRATNLLYAIRETEHDTHGLGGAGALEIAAKIDPYIPVQGKAT